MNAENLETQLRLGVCNVGKSAWPRTKAELTLIRKAIDEGKVQGIYLGAHSDGAFTPKSLSELSDFPDIKSLGFGAVPDSLFSGIENFKELEDFKCEEARHFEVTALTKLESIMFFATKDFDIGFESPRLKKLIVSKSGVSDCSFLSQYPNLECLSLIQLRKLSSLDGIDLAGKLTDFTVGYSPKLVNISALEKCKSLTSLRLETLRNVPDFSAAFEIPTLQKLGFSKCRDLGSLKNITKLKKLEHLSIIDTDVKDASLAPLLTLPALRHFGLYPNKKYFVPSASEVEKALEGRRAKK